MALHQHLADDIAALATQLQIPEQTDHAELQEKLATIWDTFANASQVPAGVLKNPDIVRGVLELVGRENVVSAVINGQITDPGEDASDSERQDFQAALRGRLETVLTLYEAVYTTFQESPALEPGALFIPLIEDLVELLSISTWRSLWTYIESQSKRFTKDMPASRGKALPLLRIINAFLRFLPRTPEDLVFRGRIHQFASSVFSVADKSAINMRGDYGEVKTVWEEPEEVEGEGETEPGLEVEGEGKQEVDADQDVEMGDAEKSEKDQVKEPMEEKSETEQEPTTPVTLSEPDFYSTLWSLQQYFAHPPSLDGPATGSPSKTPFQTFRDKSDFVLPRLFDQTRIEKELLGKNDQQHQQASKKRKREALAQNHTGGFFHPRYLTPRRLFAYEIADPSFRRQILAQYFILFQFLLNLTPAHAGKQAFTGGMPRSFVLVGGDEGWVKEKIGVIKEELKRMDGGASFEEAVFSIIRQEAHYAAWKNEGCPEGAFETPALDTTSAFTAAQAWSRRINPPFPYPFKVGSRPLSTLWNNSFTGIDQLKGREKATTLETLDDEIKHIEEDEEDDKAMGQEDPAKIASNKERKLTYTWRALRLASQTSLQLFPHMKERRDVHVLRGVMERSKVSRAVSKEEKGGQGQGQGEGEGEGEGGGEDGKAENGEGGETDDEDAQRPNKESQVPEDGVDEGDKDKDVGSGKEDVVDVEMEDKEAEKEEVKEEEGENDGDAEMAEEDKAGEGSGEEIK